ncbi:C40 family peptidase [Streptomyces sp. O3]
MASHRRPSQSGLAGLTGAAGIDRAAVRVTALSAVAAAALAATPAGAEPHDTTRDTKAEVDRLYADAERATEAYNKADARADTLRRQVARVRDSVARGQERINTMRGALGTLAGAQYRSGGIDPTLALVLSDDPDGYLDKATTLDRISARQVGEIAALRGAQRELARQRAEASRALAELEKSRTEVTRHKRAVERRLAKARRLLNSLNARERAEHDRASRSAARPDETPAPPPAAAGSGRAASAVSAVRQAVGRPYVWGANGPGGFDCSGLTQWAYAQAGVGLPRTSQAQRHAGRQVPVDQARPGDLVTYRGDASHVGMYVGGGQVVHAPYPGAAVRYDPVGMMPINSVTRV